MAKRDYNSSKEEMSLEESKAFRASLYRPAKVMLSETERREQFRLFWAREKGKYGKPKNLEQILWVHLQSMKLDNPEKFEDGLKHFGLKKLGN